MIALLMGPVLLASTVYFLLVERPCMDPRWPQKLWQAMRRTDAPVDLQTQ